MNGSAADNGSSAERAARLVHAVLLGGTMVVGVVVVAVGTRALPTLPNALPRNLLRGVVIALALFGTLALRVLRATLPALRPSDRAGWWAANAGRLVALWAVPEGIGIAGAVLAVVAGDAAIAVLALGWAVAMLLLYAPSRLAEA